MVDEISDHSGLIAHLGGAAQIAGAPSVSTLAVNVRAWAARNRIPPEYWPGIIEMASAIGENVTADWLMRTTPARASRHAAAAAS